MSLSLQQIADELNHKTSSQTLLLQTGMFTELDEVLGYLPQPQLQLSQVNITGPGTTGTVTVVGSCDTDRASGIPGIKGASATLEITSDTNHRVKLTLGGLSADWHFALSFPDLPPSYKNYNNLPGLVTLQPSVLDDFRFTGATFVAQTFSDDSFATGLNFSGNLADTTPVSFLTQNFSLAANPLLAGTIQLPVNQAPGITLKMGLGKPQVSIFGIMIDDVYCQVETSLSDEGELLTQLMLYGTASVGSTKPITVTTPVYNLSTGLEFTAEFEEDSVSIASGVQALAAFAKSDPKEFSMPGSLNVAKDLYLRSFSCHFDLGQDPPFVHMVLFTVGSKQTWNPFPGMAVQVVTFSWMILSPASDPVMSSTLEGILTFGTDTSNQVRFEIAARLDTGFSIEGSLYPGDTIDVSKLIQAAVGHTVDNLPTLVIDTLDLRAATNGDFDMSATLKTGWTLVGSDPGSSNSLSLEQVNVGFNRTGGTTTGSVSGRITLGGAGLYISAAVPGAGQGFVFTGQTAPNQTIQLLDLGNHIAKLFGVSLPDSLQDVVLRNFTVTFNTATRSFDLQCEGYLLVEDTKVDISLTINVRNTGGKYDGSFNGKVKIGPSREFTLDFSKGDQATYLFASYTNSSREKIGLQGLVADVAPTIAQYIPAALTIDVEDIWFAYARTKTVANGQGGGGTGANGGMDGQAGGDADSTGGATGGGTAATTGVTSNFLFGVALGTNLSLSDIPLVGKELPPQATIGVDDLRLLVSSQALEPEEVKVLNSSLPPSIARLPDAGVGQGLNVSAQLRFGSQVLPLSMQPQQPQAGTNVPAPTQPSRATPQQGVTASDTAKWFTLQKSFGPISFNRVGVQYQDGVLMFLLDAALTAAGLTLSLEGLGFGSPISGFDPKFKLRGLGVQYANPPVEVTGAFLKKPGSKEDEYEYEGMAQIKSGELTLAAYGAYALIKDYRSMFVYAVLDYPLGGPTFFFVKGLAAGFGYNRTLVIPTVDKLQDFALITAAQQPPPTQPLKSADVTSKLSDLEKWVPPSVGDYFLALGVKFTSFELVNGFVLLTAKFGHQLEIDLLGLATLIAPVPEPNSNVPALAEVQLAIKGSFIPDEGFLGIAAQLTPASFVLSRDCHLTGGYAFYAWFSGPHKGDFVQTLGGYPQSFSPVPAHYPQVPRLAINWQVNSQLSIKGSAYFALTPSMLMAGGALQINWASGDLRAWYNVSADFLVGWKPFHYDARVHIDIGVSYTIRFLFWTKTISCNIGADLHLWGPEFAGTAHINLDVVSFDVTFGPSSSAPQPLSWDGDEKSFTKSFLPKEGVTGVSIAGGLLRSGQFATGGNDSKDTIWIVNPKELKLVTNSVIPSTAGATGGNGNQNYGKAVIGVAPMNLDPSQLATVQKITVSRLDEESGEYKPCEDKFAFSPVLQKFPTALWGRSMTPQQASLLQSPLTDQALAGFELTPAQPPTPGHTQSVSRTSFTYDDRNGVCYTWYTPGTTFQPGNYSDEERRSRIKSTITEESVAAARQAVLTALKFPTDVVSLDAERLAAQFEIAPQVRA